MIPSRGRGPTTTTAAATFAAVVSGRPAAAASSPESPDCWVSNDDDSDVGFGPRTWQVDCIPGAPPPVLS